MNKDLKNKMINDILNVLNYINWSSVDTKSLKKKYELNNYTEYSSVCKWLENNYYVESLNLSYSHLKLTDLGFEIQENGGWIEYIKQQSDVNLYLVEKEQLEFDNLKLQNENLEYIESIRIKEAKITELTTENLTLQNIDIKYRWAIILFTFFLGLFTEYYSKIVVYLQQLIQ